MSTQTKVSTKLTNLIKKIIDDITLPHVILINLNNRYFDYKLVKESLTKVHRQYSMAHCSNKLNESLRCIHNEYYCLSLSVVVGK